MTHDTSGGDHVGDPVPARPVPEAAGLQPRREDSVVDVHREEVHLPSGRDKVIKIKLNCKQGLCGIYLVMPPLHPRLIPTLFKRKFVAAVRVLVRCDVVFLSDFRRTILALHGCTVQ